MHTHKANQRIQRFEAVCREHGLPITVQRRVLIDAVVRTDDHPTAEELWARAREVLPDISRTTVYRILDTFVDLGLVERVPHPRGAARFDGNTEPHHHLICTKCKQVFDAHDPICAYMGAPADAPEGFDVHSCSVLFLGVCRACRLAELN